MIKTFSKDIQEQVKNLKAGNTVRVHFKIQEGDKSRIQVFEGVILSKHRINTVDATITVRRTVGGFGVERIFPLHSPLIEKIEIIKVAKKIRQSKINFLRGRQGKKARLKEDVLNTRLDVVLREEKKEEVKEELKEEVKEEPIKEIPEEKVEEKKVEDSKEVENKDNVKVEENSPTV